MRSEGLLVIWALAAWVCAQAHAGAGSGVGASSAASVPASLGEGLFDKDFGKSCEVSAAEFIKKWDALESDVLRQINSKKPLSPETRITAQIFFAQDLPSDDPSQTVYAACSLLLHDLHESAFEKHDCAAASKLHEQWRSCLFVNYRSHPPALAQDLDRCYARLAETRCFGKAP